MSVFDEEALRGLIRETVRSALRDELGKVRPAQADEYLPVGEAARIAGVIPGTIRTWIDAGRLGRYHAGRVLRVKRSELDALLSAPPPAPAREPTPEERAFEIFQNRRRKARSLAE